MSRETNLRSIVKGVSWRFIATGTTMILVYLFFNNFELALATGASESILKIGLYWGHERFWHGIEWGIK